MDSPFTKEQFFDVFKNYNLAVWPYQIILSLTAVFVIFLVVKKIKISDLLINIILSIYWLWNGILFFIIFFLPITRGAYFFGALFIIQALLFIVFGVITNRISYIFKFNSYSLIGIIFIFYSLVIYPIIGHIIGHTYPKLPAFGVPCPTVIFTFGILLLTNKKIPVFFLIIPFLWSLMGISAAINYNVLQDIGLAVSGILGSVLIVIRNITITKSFLAVNN